MLAFFLSCMNNKIRAWEVINMFDLIQVGKKLANRRKELNLTQMEVADKLKVTHQAVSSWEKGLTMPDIAKLGDIAKILDISIDELLGVSSSSKLVEDIIENEENLNDATLEEIKEIAPILKPSQVNKAILNLKNSKLTAIDVITLAPFLSENVVDQILLDETIKINADELSAIIPFASKEALNQKASSVVVDDPKSLISLAPFLTQDKIDDLVKSNLDKLSNEIIIALAPFVSKDVVDEMLYKSEEVNFDLIVALCPFASSECLSRIAENRLEVNDIQSLIRIAPFVDQKAIGNLVLSNYKDEKGHDIASLAPFIEEELLTKIAIKIYRKHGLKDVLPIIHFIDSDVLLKNVNEEFKEE